MKWQEWLIVVGGIGLIQATRGEASAGIFALAALIYYSYLSIVKKLNLISDKIEYSKNEAIDATAKLADRISDR